jgi:hypothetical protein
MLHIIVRMISHLVSRIIGHATLCPRDAHRKRLQWLGRKRCRSGEHQPRRANGHPKRARTGAVDGT